VGVITGEEGKASRIEKFDGRVFGDANPRLSLWEEITSISFGKETR
jgi:hypothetical protein